MSLTEKLYGESIKSSTLREVIGCHAVTSLIDEIRELNARVPSLPEELQRAKEANERVIFYWSPN